MDFRDKQATHLLEQAKLIAEDLRQDPSVLAVILSGPLALGKTPTNDKLYFVIITDKDDGIIEHHFLNDGWGDIRHPVEMGKFPLTVATFLAEHGYSDMVSYKSLEAFRCGHVLWEKEKIGTSLIEASKKHIPAAVFIGESLHGAVSALDDAVAMYKNEDYKNAVLMAREAAIKAVDMVIRDNIQDEDFSLIEAAEKYLAPEDFSLFLQILDIEEVDESRALESARIAGEFARFTLREIGVNPEQVLDIKDRKL
jgi:hypothetical protein